MEQSWFMDLIRMFCAFLDRIVYGLIPVAYNLLIDISKYKLFGDEDISDIAGRIYAILGIFMLFKVSFSFINYIINPDTMTDKEKGVQNVIKNIIIMFVMLVMCPWAFEQLWGLQDAVLKENLIGALVFGDEGNTSQNEFLWDICEGTEDATPSKAASMGDYISIQVLRGFYQPATFTDIGYDLSDATYGGNYDEVRNFMCQQRNNATVSSYLVSNVYNAHADVDGWTVPFFGTDLDYYIINYRVIISTAVGVVVLLILVGFCMDVGMRMVKLSFLEIIAPIPIISYVEPASGKSGIFKKWTKEVGSTWISIFIRLLGLFFATSVIAKVGSLINIETGETGEASIWVYIFVIIGALMFAKKLPSMIESIFGIKLSGGFSLNPFKKIQDQALGGKQLIHGAQRITRGVGGMALGTAMGALGQQGVGHTLWSGVRSAGAGFFKNEKLGNIRANQAEYNKKMRVARANGSTLSGRIGAGMADYFGYKGTLGSITDQENNYDSQIEEANQRMSVNKQQISDFTKMLDGNKTVIKEALEHIEKGKAGSFSQTYLAEDLKLKQMQAQYEQGAGGVTEADILAQMQKANTVKMKMAKDLVDDIMARGTGSYKDSKGNDVRADDVFVDIGKVKDTINTYGTPYGINQPASASDIWTQKTTFTQTINTASAQNFPDEKLISDLQQAKEDLKPLKRIAQADADNGIKPPSFGGGKK